MNNGRIRPSRKHFLRFHLPARIGPDRRARAQFAARTPAPPLPRFAFSPALATVELAVAEPRIFSIVYTKVQKVATAVRFVLQATVSQMSRRSRRDPFYSIKVCLDLFTAPPSASLHSQFETSLAAVEQDSPGWEDLICLFACFIHNANLEKPAIRILAKKYKKSEDEVPANLPADVLLKFWESSGMIKTVYPEAAPWFPETSDMFPNEPSAKLLECLWNKGLTGYAASYLKQMENPARLTSELVDLRDSKEFQMWVFPRIAQSDLDVFDELVKKFMKDPGNGNPLIEDLLAACLVVPRATQLKGVVTSISNMFLSGLVSVQSGLFSAFREYLSVRYHVQLAASSGNIDDDARAVFDVLGRKGLLDGLQAKEMAKYNRMPMWAYQVMLPLWAGEQAKAGIINLLKLAQSTKVIPAWITQVTNADDFVIELLNIAVHGLFVVCPIESPEFDVLAKAVMTNNRVKRIDEVILKLIALFFDKNKSSMFQGIIEVIGEESYIFQFLAKCLQAIAGDKTEIPRIKEELVSCVVARAPLVYVLHMLSLSPYISTDDARKKALADICGKLVAGVDWTTDEVPKEISPAVRSLLARPGLKGGQIMKFVSESLRTPKNETLTLDGTIDEIANQSTKRRRRKKSDDLTSRAVDRLMITDLNAIPRPDDDYYDDDQESASDDSGKEPTDEDKAMAVFLTHAGDFDLPVSDDDDD